MQRKFPIFVDDGVPRVPAALIAHHNIIVPREQIDHAALSLIAPVDANNGTSFHKLTSCIISFHHSQGKRRFRGAAFFHLVHLTLNSSSP